MGKTTARLANGSWLHRPSPSHLTYTAVLKYTADRSILEIGRGVEHHSPPPSCDVVRAEHDVLNRAPCASEESPLYPPRRRSKGRKGLAPRTHSAEVCMARACGITPEPTSELQKTGF